MFPSIIPPRNSCDPVMRGALLLVLVVSAATTSAQVFSPPKQFSGGQIVVDPAGNINVVSLGGTSPNFDVFFSRSTDGGTTFSVPQNLSNDGQAQAQIGVDSHGNITVAWVNTGGSSFFSRGVFLSSLSLEPSTVTGGSPSTGKITLSGPTYIDVSVALSSSDPSVAMVPSSVTVPAGA